MASCTSNAPTTLRTNKRPIDDPQNLKEVLDGRARDLSTSYRAIAQ